MIARFYILHEFRNKVVGVLKQCPQDPSRSSNHPFDANLSCFLFVLYSSHTASTPRGMRPLLVGLMIWDGCMNKTTYSFHHCKGT